MREEGKKEEERERGERKGKRGEKRRKKEEEDEGKEINELCGNGSRRGSCCGRIQSFNRYGYIILNAQNVTSTTSPEMFAHALMDNIHLYELINFMS